MGVWLSVLTPLVAVPLTIITFYLRSLREHQLTRHHELSMRVDECHRAMERLRERSADFERDYTTKEEWLRECLHARRVREQLLATTVQLEAAWEAYCGFNQHRNEFIVPDNGTGGENAPLVSRQEEAKEVE